MLSREVAGGEPVMLKNVLDEAVRIVNFILTHEYMPF